MDGKGDLVEAEVRAEGFGKTMCSMGRKPQISGRPGLDSEGERPATVASSRGGLYPTMGEERLRKKKWGCPLHSHSPY